MKRILFILLIATVAFGQWGHKSGSSASSIMAIVADSTDWTAGSTVNAIKPKAGKTVEADSAKVGALEVTGNARFNSNVTMVTTAGEQFQLGTGSDAAPELSSAGDTNTGIRFPGGDKMQFVQNGLNSHTFRPYMYTQMYSDGDTIAIILDGTRGYIKAGCPLRIQATTAGYLAIDASPIFNWSNTGFYPNVHDSYSLGTAGNYVKTGYFSDGLVLGSKGQTARFVWGQQKDMTEEYDSTGVLDMNNGSPRIRMMSASGSEGLSYNSGSVAAWDSLNNHNEASVIADDGTISLPVGKSGWGEIGIGDMQEFVRFKFTSEAVVTLLSDCSTNTDDADTDGDLCVYDGGDHVIIKNRLGATKVIALVVHYFSP